VSGKRGTAHLAEREAESRRKARGLCCSKDWGFSEDFSEKIQEASQGKTVKLFLGSHSNFTISSARAKTIDAVELGVHKQRSPLIALLDLRCAFKPRPVLQCAALHRT
jgi:hypothetical protein